jgi:hypothetical protein
MRDSHFYGGEIDGLAYTRGEGSEIYEGDIDDRILQGGHQPSSESIDHYDKINKERADVQGITVEELLNRERAEKKEAERKQQEEINESRYYQQFTNKSRDDIISEIRQKIMFPTDEESKTKIAKEFASNYLNSNNFNEFEILEKNAKRFLMYQIKNDFFYTDGTKKYDKYGNLVNSQGIPLNIYTDLPIRNHPKLGIIRDRNGNSYGPYSGGYRKTRINKNKQIEKRKKSNKNKKKNKK